MTGLYVGIGFALLFAISVWQEQRQIELVRRLILLDLRLRESRDLWPTGPEIVKRINQKLVDRFFYTAIRSLERAGLVIHREGAGTLARGGRPTFHYQLTFEGKAAAWRVAHGLSIKVRA